MEKTLEIRKGMAAAVVGFGRAGQSVARYLYEQGARVLVSDSRKLSELTGEERTILNNCEAEFEGGGQTLSFLSGAELIVASPGVPLDIPVLVLAAEKNIPVVGELALAAGRFGCPVIAVTGTNGKTTVTELIGELLKAAGRTPFIGGNIGTPVCEYLRHPSGYDAAVLEVSSFQLESSGSFAPDVGVMLNISHDHLDRHGTLESYAAAKMRLFRDKEKTTVAIINGEDPLIGRYMHFADVESFSLFGYCEGCDAEINGNRITCHSGADSEEYDLTGTGLGTVTGCLNSAAALLAVKPLGLDADVALATLRAFQTGNHRLQKVGSTNGIFFVNDSKATNTGAVNRGLEQVGGPVVLIAGGKEKGDDFCLLRDAVRRYVRELVLIGEAAPKIAGVLSDLVPVKYAQDMQEAVRIAAREACPGDTVLLSPACASFDMFDSYIHRGEQFEKAVREVINGGLGEM